MFMPWTASYITWNGCLKMSTRFWINPKFWTIPTKHGRHRISGKSVLFHSGSRYLDPEMSKLALDKARFFYDRSMKSLESLPTAFLVRPLVLTMIYGTSYLSLVRDQAGNHGFPKAAGSFSPRNRIYGIYAKSSCQQSD